MAQIWDARSGALVVTFEGHHGPVGTARFSPDGRSVVTSSSDRTAKVWDAASGTLRTTLVGHEDRVKSALFSSDGARLLTASNDGTARVWDAQSGATIGKFVQERFP